MSKPRFDDSSKVPLLVTTALEETWGSDRSVVFLGEWCRLHDRRRVWQALQHGVIRNHWDDRGKLRADHDYLKSLHDSLLADLVPAMNRYHRIDRPLRYWQMILDPWLLTYVATVWDRWECLRLAFEKHERLETIALEGNTKPGACFDYNDFIEEILGDTWNHRLFLEIIESRYAGRCDTTRRPMDSPSAVVSHEPAPADLSSRSVKARLVEFADRLFSKLSARDRVVIFNAYFPPVALARLNLRLGQLPRLYLDEFRWPVPLDDANGRDGGAPGRNSIVLALEAKSPFEAFLLKRIVKDIPMVHVEGFLPLRARASRISMKPKAILTANAHWGNELFKLWSAERVLDGVKLVTMEHGGSIPPTLSAMSFEEDIADLRTTWATPYHPKHRRMPPNKLATTKTQSSKKYLAVVGVEMPRYNFRAEAAPKSGQVLRNCEMVCEFFELLGEDARVSFRVKPYPDRGWNTRQRFIETLGKEKVSEELDYYRFLSNARVIVCTYPQTTFSEAMASGLPSLLLYPAHLWETIPEMDSLLATLEAAKILFRDPQGAAAHINLIWEDPDRWWNSTEVLHARKEFIRQALDMDSDWLKEWTNLVLKMAA